MAISCTPTFLIFFPCLFYVSNCNTSAYIDSGKIVGELRHSTSGSTYKAFEGIPYAKPPIGDLRFKEPEHFHILYREKVKYFSKKPPCIQYDRYYKEKDKFGNEVYSVMGEEDCLYLNVYTKNVTGKPILVLINDGYFAYGSANNVSEKYIMNLDLVFITFNYRLGPLGFITTGDHVVPGNNGLKDQVAALQWIQRNAVAFGGDPNKITLIGAGTGGSCVHYHYLSPLSQGLFARGYSFGSNSLNPAAFVRDGVAKTRLLASILNCPTVDSTTLVQCLKSKSAKEIVESTKYFKEWLYNPFTVFGPVQEYNYPKAFLTDEPRNLMKKGMIADLPWITSFFNGEGGNLCAEYSSNKTLKHLNENWRIYAKNILYYSDNGNNDKALKVFEGTDLHYPLTLHNIIHIITRRLFLVPLNEAVRLQAAVNLQPVYAYFFDYSGTEFEKNLNLRNKLYGGDFNLIFELYNISTLKNRGDKDMAALVLDVIDEFTKTGKVPSKFKWTPAYPYKDAPLSYFYIKTPLITTMLEHNNIFYWKKILTILDKINYN